MRMIRHRGLGWGTLPGKPVCLLPTFWGPSCDPEGRMRPHCVIQGEGTEEHLHLLRAWSGQGRPGGCL